MPYKFYISIHIYIKIPLCYTLVFMFFSFVIFKTLNFPFFILQAFKISYLDQRKSRHTALHKALHLSKMQIILWYPLLQKTFQHPWPRAANLKI